MRAVNDRSAGGAAQQLKIESLHAASAAASDAKKARDRVRNAAGPPYAVDDPPYHHWRARFRAWRRATRPGPRFDLTANLRDTIAPGSDALLRAWSAGLSRRQRRWLVGRSWR